MTFWFQHEGEQWSLDDYTLNEMAAVEDGAAIPWVELMPRAKIKHLLVLLAVWFRRTRDEAEVAKILESLSFGNINDIVQFESGDDLPTAWRDGIPLGDDQATTGSSGASPTSAGTPNAPDGRQSAT